MDDDELRAMLAEHEAERKREGAELRADLQRRNEPMTEARYKREAAENQRRGYAANAEEREAAKLAATEGGAA